MAESSMPLVEAIATWASRSHAAFYTPGHKQGAGISAELSSLLGTALRADVPELPGLDNLFAPDGVISAAQILAAETFGADRTWFLANGSTCGIEAALLATCRPGDRIIVPRNAHQSIISGLILSGAVPVFVQPSYDASWGMALGLSVEQIQAALERYADVRAVMVVSPTYYGVCSPIQAIADQVHRYNLPLLVDEAHGPHFAFHPNLPSSALQAGADVVVQSTHKVLSALTQASMLHLQGDRVTPDRLQKALQMVQSSSPSYLLLASLDGARQQMATQGVGHMERTLALAQQARSHLAQMPGLRVLEPEYLQSSAEEGISQSNGFSLDLTRLTVDVSGLGITGFDADDRLNEEWDVIAELPTLKTLTFIISLGNDARDIQRLVQGLRQLAQQQSQAASQPLNSVSDEIPLDAPLPLLTCPSLSPREAFFADSESVAIANAIGRISAELVCPYPPGIPALLPGEVITQTAVQQVRHILAAGGIITGCSDSSLETLAVVR